MKAKEIKKIYPPQNLHFVGDGFKVYNFIPSLDGLSMRDMDPFIMLEYNAPWEVEPADTPRGLGVHPHRGFETVTISYSGKIAHHDSTGSGGVISLGDAQWMTAASGVLHKEYHDAEWSKKGGIFHMVQFWVNLPAKDKMNKPKYQSIKNEAMTKVYLDDNKSFIEVIAGEYKGQKGPAETHSPINLMNAKLMTKGAKADFSFPAHYNTALLIISGKVKVNEKEVDADNLLKFDNLGEDFTIESLSDDSIVLIMSGEPLNEPIAAYGPFVMNTQGELKQAFMDFNLGKFGYLED